LGNRGVAYKVPLRDQPFNLKKGEGAMVLPWYYGKITLF